jgi:DNA-binding NarL/FixJ family response regulator
LLSTRQYQIAQRLVQGKSTKEISADLGISNCTCTDHIKILYRKLGASTRGECTAKLARMFDSHEFQMEQSGGVSK